MIINTHYALQQTAWLEVKKKVKSNSVTLGIHNIIIYVLTLLD